MASATSFRHDILGIPKSSASPKDSVLVIIDAQNEYAKGKLAVSNLDSSRAAIRSLLDKYRQADGKIVHILHSVPEGAPVFTPGTELEKEFDELEPQGNEKVIVKKYPGSFAETSLRDELKSLPDEAPGKIVLCGYMAHVCVSTTAREAHQLGYDVVLAEDAIGDRDIPGASGEDVTRMVMLELADMFGTVVKSDEIK
ncbi:hypothetical protein W97_01434 [Coniosporium apollinis CBS 100218]|uniref:Isochorismatase-like domain-containing protein n=1 Tax=Coniosporium apollinis (strain CBS 100218) TaxID=1168221 RepID=R7YK83_CONA1|nr:uncharacterized protein W97_01434 [Coniosporium apollinis CBS 100218]EON62214.1 hypothetical protein W97_01434 [Coniosporium apollinis CBS 100218]